MFQGDGGGGQSSVCNSHVPYRCVANVTVGGGSNVSCHVQECCKVGVGAVYVTLMLFTGTSPR